jgi:hypothetical protein
VVDSVIVGSVTGMPLRRVFRYTWRDNTLVMHYVNGVSVLVQEENVIRL